MKDMVDPPGSELDVAPTPSATLLAPRPVGVLEVGPRISDVRLRRMELIPLPAAARRIRVRLPRRRRRKFHSIRHGLLQQAACVSLGTDDSIIPAGCLDSLNNFCFRGH